MADVSLDLVKTSPTYKDFLLIDNDLALTADAQSGGTNPILQDILQRVSMFLGEWFLDVTQGVPYFEQILVKNPPQSKIDAIFQNVILGTPGVLTLTYYKFEPDFASRVLSVSFVAQTTSGKVDWTGNIPVGGNLT